MKELRPDYVHDISVRIDVLDEQGRATYVEGTFDLQGESLQFKGISMDGYGGPNFSAVLPDQTLERLRQRGFDKEGIDEIIVEIQRRVMEGEATMNIQHPQKPEDKQRDADSSG